MKLSYSPESPVESNEPAPPPSHLKEGIPAIMACVGTPEQFKEYPGNETEGRRKALAGAPEVENVDYRGDPEVLARQNFKNPEKDSYVISPLDDRDKLSPSFFNCTGVIAAGCDRETGENISFLSHQDPEYFLNSKPDQETFLRDLRERLRELKERCREGTIDVAIVGGNYPGANIVNDYEIFRKHYLESIKLLTKETEAVLGFPPIVMTGPKSGAKKEDVFYENKNRRLYIMRPEVGDGTTQNFSPNDIKAQKKKW